MKAVQAGWEYPLCASFNFTLYQTAFYNMMYQEKSTCNMLHLILQRSYVESKAIILKQNRAAFCIGLFCSEALLVLTLSSCTLQYDATYCNAQMLSQKPEQLCALNCFAGKPCCWCSLHGGSLAPAHRLTLPPWIQQPPVGWCGGQPITLGNNTGQHWSILPSMNKRWSSGQE